MPKPVHLCQEEIYIAFGDSCRRDDVSEEVWSSVVGLVSHHEGTRLHHSRFHDGTHLQDSSYDCSFLLSLLPFRVLALLLQSAAFCADEWECTRNWRLPFPAPWSSRTCRVGPWCASPCTPTAPSTCPCASRSRRRPKPSARFSTVSPTNNNFYCASRLFANVFKIILRASTNKLSTVLINFTIVNV